MFEAQGRAEEEGAVKAQVRPESVDGRGERGGHGEGSQSANGEGV